MTEPEEPNQDEGVEEGLDEPIGDPTTLRAGRIEPAGREVEMQRSYLD